MEREIEMLSKLLESPEHPFAAILGGAKVSDKIAVIDNLLTKVDMLVLGGGMANTFLLAQGKAIGKSLAEPDRAEDARRILATAEKNGVRVVLPVDVIVAKEVTRGTEYKTLQAEKIPASWHIVDLGKASQELMVDALMGMKTVFWNGPLGRVRDPVVRPWHERGRPHARRRADAGATVVVGGGDSVAAVRQQGLTERMTHISTGGGASLEFLEGRELPGVSVLLDRPKTGKAAKAEASRRRLPRRPGLVREHADRGDRRARDPRFAGQPNHRGGRRPRRRVGRARGGPVGRVDRRARGGRAARTGIRPVRRQGRASGGRESSPRRSRPRSTASTRPIRPASTHPRRPRWDGQQGDARRERDPRRLARVRARRRGRLRPAALPYLGGVGATTCLVPMFNILNGGKHAQDSTDFQEFMVMPVGVATYGDALRAGPRCSGRLRSILHAAGHSTGQGDEGGFAPSLPSNEAAVEVIVQAIEKGGYRPGDEVAIALDPATSELVDGGGDGRGPVRYALARGPDARFWASWSTCGRSGWTAIRSSRSRTVSAEDDWDGWRELTARLGDRVQLVGDDLFVTNTERHPARHREDAANSVLIKLNQIGTLTETIDAIAMARRAGWSAVVSHRSGETEDTTIADLVVAMGTGRSRPGRRHGRARREVQPAAAHRGRARRRRTVPGPGRLAGGSARRRASAGRRAETVS
jgi:enolase